MKRKCLECGELFDGRSDKKFCSDQCRNTYNNKLKKDSNNMVRRINNILRKNRRVLKELNPNGKAKVQKNLLVENGFNFDYLTNVYQTKKGGMYKFCYDQGYIELEDGMVAIVERQEYV
jgi:predicted nucleic acid-binding Zn ribbon protein